MTATVSSLGGRPTLDVSVEQLEGDPYPIYEHLRQEAPTCWIPAIESWLITRWADVVDVVNDTEHFGAQNDPVDRAFGTPNVLSCEGPLHKELRSTLSPSLRPSSVDTYIESLVEPFARRYLEAMRERDEAEIMAEYFEPVSVLSLASILGMGDVEEPTLRRWFAAMALGASNYEGDEAKQATSDEAVAELEAYLAPTLERLESEPDESLLSHMLYTGVENGGARRRELVLPTLKVLILGGMQEPGHGAGTVLYFLLQHPDQLEAVAADPETLLPAAIEEGMRLIAPIGSQGRIVLREREVAGVSLPVGDVVLASIASANRDAERFPQPDRFDVHRSRSRVATFGFGTHFCSGHAFARALERISLRVLLEELPSIRLDEDTPPVFGGFEFRAPRKMRVTW